MEILDQVKLIVKTLDLKKAEDITVLKIDDLTVISDYFVIASATNSTQLKALANEVEFELEKVDVRPVHTEGYDGGIWVLLDYGSIIVHIFMQDSIMFYSLERLWSDAQEIDISDMLN